MTKSEKNSLIVEYASLLAERDLTEKHDLLAHQLRNEDGEYLDKYQGEFDEYYDTHSTKLTKLSQSLVKNEMDKLWDEYVEKNGTEPLFAVVAIQEEEAPHFTSGVIINMSGDVDDENVFHCCTSLGGLKSLTEKGGENFTIISIDSFGT